MNCQKIQTKMQTDENKNKCNVKTNKDERDRKSIETHHFTNQIEVNKLTKQQTKMQTDKTNTNW